MNKNWPKFPVLFSLYIAQSIPMSFFSTVVPVIMRQQQYSLESIGLLQLVKLPWIFKFLWAPLVDNRAKKTAQLRKWIVFSEIFYAVIILVISTFSLQTDFRLIVILMVIAFIASATQDIATDKFAILILKHNERSFGNSMQSAGSFTGTLFGTGVLLIAYHYFGWNVLLMLLAAFVVVALLPLYLYRGDKVTDPGSGDKISLKAISRFFGQKNIHRRILILVFYYSGIIGSLAMLKPFLVDLGYGVKEIGFMSGIVGTSVAALCALLGGYLVRHIGRRSSLYIFILVTVAAASWLWYISLGKPDIVSIYIAICLLWGAYGLSTVVIYTTSMDIVRKGTEGTDFTLQIVITHLSSLVIAVMSGRIGDAIGYSGLFGIEVIMALFTFVLLFYAVPRNLNYGNTR